MKKYSKDHLWVERTPDGYAMGLSEFLSTSIGEIESLDLPVVPKKIQQGDVLLIVEAKKAAIELIAPLNGTITKLNPLLNPTLINADPETKGWICLLALDEPSDFDTLIESTEYIGLTCD